MTEKEPNGNTCPVKNQLGFGWNSQRLLSGGKFLEVNVVCETREAAEVYRVPADDHKLDAVPDHQHQKLFEWGRKFDHRSRCIEDVRKWRFSLEASWPSLLHGAYYPLLQRSMILVGDGLSSSLLWT